MNKSKLFIALFGIMAINQFTLAQDSPKLQSNANSDSITGLDKDKYTCNAVSYDFNSEVVTSATKDPIKTKAEIEKKALYHNNDGTLFKYSLANISLEGVSQAQKTALLKSIGTNLYIYYKPDGTAHELYGYKSSPLWDYNALKAIILPLQVIVPTTGPSLNNYQIEEKDDKGVVLADYEVASNQAIKKQRRSYKELWSKSAAINLENSDITIELNDRRTIIKIDMRERISIGSQKSPLFSSDNYQQILLKQNSQTKPIADAPCIYSSLADALEKEQLIRLPFESIANTDMLRQQKLQQLSNVSLNDLVAKLHPNEGKEIQHPAEIVATLIDLFTYYPDNLKKVPDLLEKYIEDRQFSSFLIASVSNVQINESAEILLDIMKRFNNNPDILMQTILAHHSILFPSPANAEYLISLYQASKDPQFKTIVILAIGSLANKLDAIKTDNQPHPTTDFLIGEMTNDSQDSNRFAAISAIENSSDIYAFPSLQRIIETEQNPELIGRAIKAIRKMPSEKANPMLVKMLAEKHDNTNITLAALLAFQGRGLDDDKTIQLILNDYHSYYIKLKLEALDLILENQIASKPVVLAFIKDLQSSDKTSEAEKDVINNHLGKYSNSR